MSIRGVARSFWASCVLVTLFATLGLTMPTAHVSSRGKSVNGEFLCTHEQPIASIKPTAREWHDVIGERVVVQGIAWGAFEKPSGPYIILNRAVIYVRHPRIADTNIQGRPVEVAGTLVLETSRRPDRTAPGGESPIQTFLIEADTIKVLEKVSWPWMRSTNPKLD